MKIRSRLKVYSGAIEVAPLIDVIFLLLIFFMLNSTRVFQPGIPVELPKASTSSKRTAQKIIITIAQNDEGKSILYFNDNPVPWDKLKRRLAELVYDSRVISARRRPDISEGDAEERLSPMVVLRADENVPYRQIVEVMSLARSLNLGVYLATEVPGKQPGARLQQIP